MNKLLIGLVFVLSFSYLGLAGENDPAYQLAGTAVTNLAASSTNTGSGAIISLNQSPSPVRIYLKAMGYAATTNGVSAVSNLVVKLSTASGSSYVTNDFDTANLSNIKLTMTSINSQTNLVSDWFVLGGAKYLRVGQIENNFLGSVSNLQVIIGYPK